MVAKHQSIVIKGAKVHNLKNIDAEIPSGSFTVVTGVSGSGKSSLVFDTLFAEGQRRYVESLSSYARQFLGRMNKPEVDFIEGLAPAIAIEQKVNTRNPRSTVSTSTEIYDYLKLLFSRVGHTISPISGKEVVRHTTEDVVNFFLSMEDGQSVLILSQIDLKKGKENDILSKYIQQGFVRMLIEDSIVKIADVEVKKDLKKGKVYLVIDRLICDRNDEDLQNRSADSIESAFWEGHGTCYLKTEDGFHEFSNKFELDGINFEIPSKDFLSFNNPLGACKTCEGYGQVIGIDEDLVIPDKNLSVYEGCVQPWKGESMSEWKEEFVRMAIEFDFPVQISYYELNESEKDLLWQGNVKVQGINAFFSYIEEKAYKIQYRVMLSRYRGKTTCPDCKGTRLRKDASYVKLISVNKDKNIPKHISIQEIMLMSIDQAQYYFDHVQLSETDMKIGGRIFTEIKNRLIFLKNVGLGYLGLNRLSNTLSGGESQRINLATSLGSSLTGSLYILDEPSIGLHPRDTKRLIEVLKNLQNIGNTVIVVEHEEEMMLAADRIIDIGPEAGTKGGELVYSGDFKGLLKSEESLTGKYLSNRLRINIPESRRKWKNSIDVFGARENNLKNIDVRFPLQIMTCVTGVSGSGKTTLVKSILYPGLNKAIGNYTGTRTGKHDNIAGDMHLVKQIEMVDQNPIGKSSRSNPITYIKAYDSIRDLFAELPLSKAKKLKPSHFSFNVDGGRCEHCKGEGEVTIEMQFMADLILPCEFCNGKRFKEEILEIKFNDKNISDILEMTVDESMEFFKDKTSISSKIAPLQDVGLGYVSLGQSSNTLSGGEAQRIKLATFLGKGNSKETHTLFIFDEPTTGLHFNDIQKLLYCFNALIDKGHSVLIIEHNPDIIKCADWVIDLGPEGGNEGGNLVFEGTPEELLKSTKSYTGIHLIDKMNLKTSSK
ncbi:MAG: excinuclease ABC subunit UvrA [Bacteroidia bacterium]|nr:excinuclease ABC subunit UvrA [Bacteroidia bacterium]